MTRKETAFLPFVRVGKTWAVKIPGKATASSFLKGRRINRIFCACAHACVSMGVSICLWQSKDNFSDILRKPSLWNGFSLSWNLPIRRAGLASRPQGSSQALVLWVCVTMPGILTWFLRMKLKSSCLWSRLAFSHLSYFFNPEKKKNKIHENELKANRQKIALGVEGFGQRWGQGRQARCQYLLKN